MRELISLSKSSFNVPYPNVYEKLHFARNWISAIKCIFIRKLYSRWIIYDAARSVQGILKRL